MKLPARKTVVTSLIVAGVLGTLAWLALREPTQLASVAQVRYGPMEEQFSEEGKTRLKARYSVTAPVAGTLQRIGLQPGDAVKAGQTVAWIDPASPGLLDARSRTQLRAELAAAEQKYQSARHHVNATRAALDQASSALKRARKLRDGNAISQEALENAQMQAASTRANWSAARADAQTAQQQVAAARAALLEGDAEAPAGGEAGPAGKAAVKAGASGRTEPASSPVRKPIAVLAPVDGVVLKRPLDSAVPVTLGQQLLEMGDTAQLEVEAEVLSSDAVKVRPGMTARLLRWGGPGERQAHVTRVEPGGFTKVSALGVDEQRTRVILDIDSPRQQWMALGDAYRVELEFVLRHEDRVLQVPASALFIDTRKAAEETTAGETASDRERPEAAGQATENGQPAGLDGAAGQAAGNGQPAGAAGAAGQATGNGQSAGTDGAAGAAPEEQDGAQQGTQGSAAAAAQAGSPRYAVYRVENGRARLSPVKTGMRSATHVQVLDGLKEGDMVIVQPDDRVAEGVRIEGH